MKSGRTWLFALGAIVLCVFLVAIIGLFVAYAAPRAAPVKPLVRITSTVPEGSAVAAHPVVVFGQASDPGGIAAIELWVNGQKVAGQDNPNPGSSLPFETSQAWIPNAAGNYLLTLKATNNRKFAGESDPVLITVGERSFEPDPQLTGEYIVAEGDSWESIAAGLGISPADLHALNPDVTDLTPGASLRIPPRPEGDAAGDEDTSPGPTDIGDTPRIDPAVPSPPGGGATDAAPDSGGWFGLLPLPAGTICLLNPALCGSPTDVEPPPTPAPADVTTSPAAGCGVDVFWTDDSPNETGFRLYRITSRPRFRFDLVELFGPAAGTGTRLHYLDSDPPRGTFMYVVVAYNAGGDTWSAPSPEVTSEGCRTEFVALTAVVEALEIHVADGFDRLYCYASLADSPFERIPHGAGSFITLDGADWNIAEHFSGSNKRPAYVYGEALNIIVECLGWQGGELINLGRFSRSHPREEWDGRPLNATSDTGGFSVVYRINEGYETADDATGRTEWPLVDHTVPAPYNLREVDGWQDCERLAGGASSCSDVSEPALAWDYTARAAPPRPAIRYEVYFRAEGDDVPRHYHTATAPSRSAPLVSSSCGTATYYSVSAVVGEDPLTHEPIQSPPSSELRLEPRCASLEVTLTTFWVYGVYDGDPCFVFSDCRDDYEAYGWIGFNGSSFVWNDHCDPGFGGGCIRSGPNYTAVLEASEHNWADMWLNTGGGWHRGNNVIRIPIRDGEPLNLSFLLWDHDDGGDDDTWCGTRGRAILPARSAAEWLTVDQDVALGDPAAASVGNCILRFHVRGVPGG